MMALNSDLANKLRDFLRGSLSLSDYRVAMMHVRLDELESLPLRDQNFVYDFETRYAQLVAGAITEYTFKQLLAYAATCESTGSNQQTKVWLLSELPAVPAKPTTVETEAGSYSENCELVSA